ncbi:MAG: 2-amino-4-hydroxy-6-hydroxymethyldihydropteridine diphosphokinase [Sulfitobacter sp.]
MLLALGANLASNVGSPSETLKSALCALEKKGGAIRNISPFYSTPAYPAGNGPDYVNAAAEICAEWSARETLAIFHEIEAEMGRERVQRWGQRTLDLDLLAIGDVVLPDAQTHATWRNLAPEDQIRRTPDQLILPHPRLQDRAFVLVPLADVAPNWVHPVLNRTVVQMRDALPSGDVVAVKLLQ